MIKSGQFLVNMEDIVILKKAKGRYTNKEKEERITQIIEYYARNPNETLENIAKVFGADTTYVGKVITNSLRNEDYHVCQKRLMQVINNALHNMSPKTKRDFLVELEGEIKSIKIF